MNPEEVHKLLDDAVPAPPSVKGWAGAAGRRVRRRRALAGAAVVVAVLAVPAGFLLARQPPLVATPGPAGTPPVPVTPTGPVELVGQGSILQYADEELPHLCLGAVASSYPPQCGGPTLKGDFSWDDVEFTDAGTRWTDATYQVFGHYDPGDGDAGSFTLTRPVRVAPAATDPGVPQFPQLCDDPLRGADPARTGFDAQEALTTRAQELPLVGLWVSDGSSFFNVAVQGDAASAHARLREVWGGKLCVASSDAPMEAERVAALDRIMAALPVSQALGGSGGSGFDPVVEVDVTHADVAVLDQIRSVAARITVRVTSVFAPVGADHVTTINP